MKKRRIVYIIMMLLVSVLCHAQDARYFYKPTKKSGCQVSFTAYGVPNEKYIQVKITADHGITFTENPEMTLWTADGDSLKLKGKNLHVVDVTDGKYKHGLTSVYGYAQFLITDKQIEKLWGGVSAIRLSTLPEVHEREFTKDKIGKRLYYALTR